MPQMMMLHSSTSLLTSLCPCKCLTCTELQSLECNAPSAPGALALSDTNEYLQNFAWIALTTAAARIKWIVRMTGIMLSGIRASPCIPLACGHRLRGRSLPMLQASRRNRTSGRSRQQQVVQAAAASFSPDDPYKILGLHQGADSEAVQRQYNKLKREKRGDEEAITKIENAHSSLMMRNLTARMQGGVSVAKEVKYADKAQYLPWRPRAYRADNKLLLYSGIVQALLAAWALLLSVTAGTQPVVASAVVGGVGNVWKLNQVFPTSTSSTASEDEKKKGLKNILRGCLLAFLATFAGCFLFFTLPDLVASQLNKQLPYWFYANEKVLLCVGTTLCNFLMTAFFR